MLKVLYGCCYIGKIETKYDIDYVDIIPGMKKENGNYICSDIRQIDFNKYDIIICSPPCNYYSRANYRRETSKYAQQTKDLLPYCIKAALNTGKDFIIENVINRKLMKDIIKEFPYNIYYIGRHTYFTNSFINLQQEQIKIVKNIELLPQSKRQGGINVENVFNLFLMQLEEKYG